MLLLVGMILLYDWIHKKTVWAVVPMGACRFLLYLVIGLSALHGTVELTATPAGTESPYRLQALLGVIVFGSALFLYIITLTLAARAESGEEELKLPRRSVLLLYLPVAAWVIVLALDPALGKPTFAAWFKESGPQLLTGMIMVAVFVIWTYNAVQLLHDDELDRDRIGEAVGRFLPGICLIDGLAVSAAGAGSVPALICFGCFILSLALQSWCPALERAPALPITLIRGSLTSWMCRLLKINRVSSLAGLSAYRMSPFPRGEESSAHSPLQALVRVSSA